MAIYTYTIDDFSLSSSIQYGNFGEKLLQWSDGRICQSFPTSRLSLAEGEVINKAVVTADLSWNGDRTCNETITINGSNFYSGVYKLHIEDLIIGEDWSAEFCFKLAYNPQIDGASAAKELSVTKTVVFENVVLTITTGSDIVFDGSISSLPEGTKIYIDESNGVMSSYSIVHHGYNDGLCLLWRDTCIDSSVAFNHTANSFLSDNNGVLDEYLNETFYNSLPDFTRQCICLAIYPTLNQRLYGDIVDLQRYVCTPSVREQKESVGADEWHGFPLAFLDTVICEEVYWTRSVYAYESGLAYRIGASGSSYTYNRGYATGVRPCFCVSETQLVRPADSEGSSYVLAAAVLEPAAVYLNGNAVDMVDQQRDAFVVLSWDAVDSDDVMGYEVFCGDAPDGNYIFYGAVMQDDQHHIPSEIYVRTGSKGFEQTYYRVKATTSSDTAYLDSKLSDAYRGLATKQTNMHYFDGSKWLLATTKHYDNDWTQLQNIKYHNGTSWITTG